MATIQASMSSPWTVQAAIVRPHLSVPCDWHDTFHVDNMLTRGQEIAVEVDESKTVAMALGPGEMSIHNVRVAHASGPNTSDDRRIGMATARC